MIVMASGVDGSENSEMESEKGFRGDSLLKFVSPFTMSVISQFATIFLFFFFLFFVFSTKILQIHGIEMQTVFFGIANLLDCYFAGMSNIDKQVI